MTDPSLYALHSKLQKYNQEHLLKHWNTLAQEKRDELRRELDAIDYERVQRYFRMSTQATTLVLGGKDNGVTLEPIAPHIIGGVTSSGVAALKRYEDIGLRQIAEGRVAAVLLAGGQGTRLGVAYPKGMYKVGLPSRKPLYQLQAERILKLQELANRRTGKEGVVPWYIMTSEHTQAPTLDFLAAHNYFGLQKQNIVVFEQHNLPCLSFDGKIILEKPYKVSLAPDGNGGLYRALGDRGILQDMRRRGVRYVHVYCVDNILVKVADPIFIGYCVERGADCGAKAVDKAYPTEPIGVICSLNEVNQVVEYSELPANIAQLTDPKSGKLVYNTGNICNHFMTVDFIDTIINTHEYSLEHHVARKKIPYCSEDTGDTVTPAQPNGIKMEKFVFDVFRLSKQFVVWNVPRDEEFSPLKNSDGSATVDTPTTSKNSLFALHERWIRRAGGRFSDRRNSGSGDKNDQLVCEISPLLSYFGEGLEDIARGKCFIPPLVLKAPGETEGGEGRVVLESKM